MPISITLVVSTVKLIGILKAIRHLNLINKEQVSKKKLKLMFDAL